MALPKLFTDAGTTNYAGPPAGAGGTATTNGGATPGGQTLAPKVAPNQVLNDITQQAQPAPVPPDTIPVAPAVTTPVVANPDGSALIPSVSGVLQSPAVLIIGAVVILYFLFKS